MLNEFLSFINELGLPLTARKTLLTVSGGVDSMVMATLFHKAGLPFAIAHCNFGLRGEESDGDEDFVRKWAQSHERDVHVRRFETDAKATQEGISIQMAARELRYTWFDELLTLHQYDYLAVAHHANDVLETTLLNLVRGTGPFGLPGMAPVQGQRIRPLLFASREQIIAYARKEQIDWREDSSNQSDSYRRNFLRHQVIPALQQLNPSLEATFIHTSERLRAANSLLSSQLTAWKALALRKKGLHAYIALDILQQAQEPVFQLHFLLDSYGYSYAQTRQIVATLTHSSGKIFYSPSHELVKDRTELIITPRDLADTEVDVLLDAQTNVVHLPNSLTLKISRLPLAPDFTPVADRTTAFFDEAKLVFPLRIRSWKQGDWFCPQGMKGQRKKISDLLIDQKVSLPQKKECTVLVNGDQKIIWVIGVRTDDRFKITDTTRAIIKINMETPDKT